MAELDLKEQMARLLKAIHEQTAKIDRLGGDVAAVDKKVGALHERRPANRHEGHEQLGRNLIVATPPRKGCVSAAPRGAPPTPAHRPAVVFELDKRTPTKCSMLGSAADAFDAKAATTSLPLRRECIAIPAPSEDSPIYTTCSTSDPCPVIGTIQFAETPLLVADVFPIAMAHVESLPLMLSFIAPGYNADTVHAATTVVLDSTASSSSTATHDAFSELAAFVGKLLTVSAHALGPAVIFEHSTVPPTTHSIACSGSDIGALTPAFLTSHAAPSRPLLSRTYQCSRVQWEPPWLLPPPQGTIEKLLMSQPHENLNYHPTSFILNTSSSYAGHYLHMELGSCELISVEEPWKFWTCETGNGCVLVEHLVGTVPSLPWDPGVHISGIQVDEGYNCCLKVEILQDVTGTLLLIAESYYTLPWFRWRRIVNAWPPVTFLSSALTQFWCSADEPHWNSWLGKLSCLVQIVENGNDAKQYLQRYLVLVLGETMELLPVGIICFILPAAKHPDSDTMCMPLLQQSTTVLFGSEEMILLVWPLDCLQNELLLLQPWPPPLGTIVRDQKGLEFMVALVALKPWLYWKCFSLEENFSLPQFATRVLCVTSPWDPGDSTATTAGEFAPYKPIRYMWFKLAAMETVRMKLCKWRMAWIFSPVILQPDLQFCTFGWVQFNTINATIHCALLAMNGFDGDDHFCFLGSSDSGFVLLTLEHFKWQIAWPPWSRGFVHVSGHHNFFSSVQVYMLADPFYLNLWLPCVAERLGHDSEFSQWIIAWFLKFWRTAGVRTFKQPFSRLPTVWYITVLGSYLETSIVSHHLVVHLPWDPGDSLSIPAAYAVDTDGDKHRLSIPGDPGGHNLRILMMAAWGQATVKEGRMVVDADGIISTFRGRCDQFQRMVAWEIHEYFDNLDDAHFSDLVQVHLNHGCYHDNYPGVIKILQAPGILERSA